MAVGRGWFLDNINANILLIKRRRLRKKDKIKEDKIKGIPQYANYH